MARADNWNPTSKISWGAVSRSKVAAPPKAVQASTGTPASRPPSSSPAITPARSTDGSHRVTRTNKPTPSSPTPARTRGPMGISPRRSQTPPRKMATFPPDTATKCSSPARRMSSSSVAPTAEVSPIRKPRIRAPAWSTAGNSLSTRERRALAYAMTPPGCATTSTTRAATRPAIGRRWRRPGLISSRPTTCTRAPTMRSGCSAALTATAAPPAAAPVSGRTTKVHPPPKVAGAGSLWATASKATVTPPTSVGGGAVRAAAPRPAAVASISRTARA